MKTLILCVDRDDDVGQKGQTATPCVGRRRCMDAALALGLADPQDSDVNAILAAVSLHDKEARAGTDHVEVAVVAGTRNLGLAGDRKLAGELDQVLATVRPDEVVLVSDGAEDEQIMPLLTSRAKVVHVHRTIVKQAPHLEGFYYTITRLLDDDKQSKRFVLPLALVFLLWGAATLTGHQEWALGGTLALLGGWLLMHAMHMEEAVGRFLAQMGDGLRRGRLTILSTLGMLILLVGGVVLGLQSVEQATAAGTPERPRLMPGLIFVGTFLPYLVAALLVRIAGSLFDAWIRDGRAGARLWAMGFGLIAFGLLATAAVDITVEYLNGVPVLRLVTLGRLVQVLSGVAVAMGAFVVGRYVRDSVARAAA